MTTYDYGQQSNRKWFQRTCKGLPGTFARIMLSPKEIDYRNKSKPGTKTYKSVVKIQSIFRGYRIRDRFDIEPKYAIVDGMSRLTSITDYEKRMKAWLVEQQFAGVRVERV